MKNDKLLNQLYSKLNEYDFIVKVLSDVNLSEAEIDEFISQHRNKIEEMNRIRKKISEIEWKSMNYNQQQDYLDKYSDD